MSTESAAAEAPESDDRPRLLALEVGEWPGLGRTVRLELDSRSTVLVGKNGAGKSLLLEGIFQAVKNIWSPAPEPTGAPRYFRCDVDRPGASPVAYQYEYSIPQGEADEDLDMPSGRPSRERVPSWSERCWELLDNIELWRVEKSTLTLNGQPPVPFFPGFGLLGTEPSAGEPPEVEQIVGLLYFLRFVRAGIPRSTGLQRRHILVSRRGDRIIRRASERGRIETLAFRLVALWQHRREFYEEFVEILRQVGLVHDVTIKIYKDAPASLNAEDQQDFVAVLFDELNIGLQSDGTLRIAEIVLNLIDPASSALLIEEPETAVHPGLLSRLLALMESYAFDRQLIISTHSPIVVNWCRPNQLRLVERVNKATTVRALDHEHIQKVVEYLEDQGTFSDFIFEREST